MRNVKLIYGFLAIFLIVIVIKLVQIASGVDNLQENIHNVIASNEVKHIINPLPHNVTVFCVTPTYWRPVQKAEMTRISQVLILASYIVKIQWIVIEDTEVKTTLVTNFIKNLAEGNKQLTVHHLNAKTPQFEKLRLKDPRWKKHRGVEQRNMALKWLRENVNGNNEQKNIVYFMDDDNTYDVRIFKEIAKVKKVGVWPVGLVGGLNAESPIVDPQTGKITGYKSGWKPNRPFAIDMAGFGINLNLIQRHQNATFSYKMEKGYQESEFLSYFITKQELEPLADKCTKVYVWHTRTENPKIVGTIPGMEV